MWASQVAGASDENLLPIARALTRLATSHRDRGAVLDSLSLYQLAVAGLERAPATSDAHVEAAATAWVNQGIAWTRLETEPALRAGLLCFEEGIRLRESRLDGGDPWSAYNLAGAWIQRGDVLRRLPEGHGSVAILECYRTAGDLIDAQVDHPDRRFARRLALARVHLAESLAQAGRLAEAARAANQSLDAARIAESHAGGEVALVAAKAHLLLALHGPEEARIESAEAGLALLADRAKDERAARLRTLLFRVAANGYARHQPHFLTEFIDEQLALTRDPGTRAALRPWAAHALRSAIAGLTSSALAEVGRGGMERTLATLRSLRERAATLLDPAASAGKLLPSP